MEQELLQKIKLNEEEVQDARDEVQRLGELLRGPASATPAATADSQAEETNRCTPSSIVMIVPPSAALPRPLPLPALEAAAAEVVTAEVATVEAPDVVKTAAALEAMASYST